MQCNGLDRTYRLYHYFYFYNYCYVIIGSDQPCSQVLKKHEAIEIWGYLYTRLPCQMEDGQGNFVAAWVVVDLRGGAKIYSCQRSLFTSLFLLRCAVCVCVWCFPTSLYSAELLHVIERKYDSINPCTEKKVQNKNTKKQQTNKKKLANKSFPPPPPPPPFQHIKKKKKKHL